MSDPCVSYDPLTTSHSTAKLPLGTEIRRKYGGRMATFVYVLNTDIATVSGYSLCPSSATEIWEVTADRSADLHSLRVVGVAVGVIAAGEYGFIMTRGQHDSLLTDGSVAAAGEYLMPHASTDGAADVITAGTNDYLAFAVALGADVSTAVAADIICR